MGTAFGVEVDKSGATKSHVFQGNVELQLVGGGRQDTRRVLLGEDKSATVEAGQLRPVTVVRETDSSKTLAFVLRMPRRVPIELFSTGVGLKEGEQDPHWRIVTGPGDLKFKPQAAVVTVADKEYLKNDPAWAQWISTASNLPPLPRGWYTFRTTFELPDGAAAESAVVRGRFLVDNKVSAIRLNGHAVSVPQHSEKPPFNRFHSFVAEGGFVAGTNVLEVDVYNYATLRGAPTAMALRMELEGAVLRGSHVSAANLYHNP